MKKYSKEFFAEFFEQFKGKALSPEELDTYVKTFTKYLNTNAQHVINSHSVQPNIISTKKSISRGKYAPILAIILLLLSAIVMVGSFIIAGILIPQTEFDTYSDILLRCLIAVGMWAGLNTIWYPMLRKIQDFYFRYKNSFKLHIGDICVWDPNGVYNSFSNENDVDSPRIVQITAISKDSIYFFSTTDGRRFKIPIEAACLLFKMSTKNDNDFKLIIRYPLALPSFSLEEVKILEAAMIHAKRTNEPKLYDAIGKVLEKVRFYNDHPYGDYNDVMSSYRQFSDFMQNTLNNFTIRDSNDEEDDGYAFGNPDSEEEDDK